MSDKGQATEPLRHFMPPGDHAPVCGSRERLPYRAIDGKPATCPWCIAYLREALSLYVRPYGWEAARTFGTCGRYTSREP